MRDALEEIEELADGDLHDENPMHQLALTNVRRVARTALSNNPLDEGNR
jgi:hypothetical protein